MKKLLLICATALLMTACTDKNNYEEAVLTQMKTEQDIKDYNIAPDDMTECVVEVTAKKMPGMFPLDPDRMMAYRLYTKMVSMSSAKDKKKVFEELKSSFGSPEELRDAHSNYTDSLMTCINIFTQRAVDAAEE